MAEEKAAAEAPNKGGLMKKLILLGGIIVAAALAGLGVFFFVIAPMFAEPAEQDAANQPAMDIIPPNAVLVDFKQQRASVKPVKTGKGALLQYSVSLVCSDGATAALVEERRPFFSSMLVSLHDSRTKDELMDPTTKSDILRQAKEKANGLLQRIQEQPDPALTIIDVIYTEFTIIDL